MGVAKKKSLGLKKSGTEKGLLGTTPCICPSSSVYRDILSSVKGDLLRQAKQRGGGGNIVLDCGNHKLTALRLRMSNREDL